MYVYGQLSAIKDLLLLSLKLDLFEKILQQTPYISNKLNIGTQVHNINHAETQFNKNTSDG